MSFFITFARKIISENSVGDTNSDHDLGKEIVLTLIFLVSSGCQLTRKGTFGSLFLIENPS